MPFSGVTNDEDGLAGDATMSNEHMADFHAASLRASMTRHPGLLPGQTSVRQMLSDTAVDRLRTVTQKTIGSMQESIRQEIDAGTFQPGTPKKGDLLDLKEYLGGRLFVGMPPETYSAMRKAAKPKAAPDDDIFSLGYARDAKVLSLGYAKDQDVQSLGRQGDLEVTSLGRKADVETTNKTFTEDDPAFPTFPRRPGTLVDSLSLISLLNQPRPLSMADADSVIARITRKDPFAASLLGKAPPSLLLPATADEVKRVINHEVLVDLNFQGYDFARPADIFEKLGSKTSKAPALDPARRKLVDFLVTWGSYVAATSKLAPAGTVDVESPLGFAWINRSLRDPTTGISEQLGKIRAGIGESMTPYVIDFRDPVTSYLFPGGSGPKAVDHPVQSFLSESLGFIMDYLAPGTNIKDAMGRHFMPMGAGSGQVYRTVGNWREEFGAPKSETILGLDGQIRTVSVDPSPSNSIGRGWFGWNPGGDALDRWNEIRGAQASGVIDNPALGPRSTLKNLSFWGGTYTDPYRADSTFVLQPQFKYRKTGVDPKTGLVKFDAVFSPSVQLDHVQPLNWMMNHGGKEMAEIAAQMWVGGTDVKKGWSYDLPRRKADIENGEVIRAHVGDRLVATDTLGTNDVALQMMGAFAKIGYAANPLQFVLTSAELNQEKSDKGPQGWVPYPHAKNAAQHQANVSYVERWRELAPYHRKLFEDILDRPLPDLFRPRRDDELAMREIELGVDTMGRLTRPFGELYTQYIDSPSLSEIPLYRRIQAMKYLSVWGMGSSLRLWSLKPSSQVYLMIRRHLGDGLWNSMVPAGKAFDFKAAPISSRFRQVGHFYRERWAGIPFVGASKSTGAAGSTEALQALEELVRSGRTAAAVDRYGELLESTARAYPVGAATPRQIFDYYRGAEEPFGQFLSKMHTGDELGQAIYSEKAIHQLNASPLVLEVFQKLKAGKFGQATNTFLNDMLIKSADYGLRGAMGVGAGIGNLLPSRLIPILGVEAFANLAGSMTGATVSTPMRFSPYHYKGGALKWMLTERAARAEEFALAQAELAQAYVRANRPYSEDLLFGERRRMTYAGQRGDPLIVDPANAEAQFASLQVELSDRMNPRVRAMIRDQMETIERNKQGFFHPSPYRIPKDHLALSLAELQSMELQELDRISPFARDMTVSGAYRSNVQLRDAFNPYGSGDHLLGRARPVNHAYGRKDYFGTQGKIDLPAPVDGPMTYSRRTLRPSPLEYSEYRAYLNDLPDAQEAPVAFGRRSHMAMQLPDEADMIAKYGYLDPPNEMPSVFEYKERVPAWKLPAESGPLYEAQNRFIYAAQAHNEFEALLRGEGADLLRIAEMPGIRGKILRAATEHPRTVAAATKVVVRGATHAKEVLQAPFVFQSRLASKIASNRYLSAGSHAFGGAMTILGGVESYARYSRAKTLSSMPVDSMPLELRAELDAYQDGGSHLKRILDGFLDAGAPLGPPVTLPQLLIAVPGVALATANMAGRATVRGRLQGSSFQDSIQVRLLRNAPTFTEQARVEREQMILMNKGLIQDTIRATSLNAMSRDTTEMFRMMNDAGAKKGMDRAKIDEKIAAVRQWFLMIPATDSLGYKVTTDKYGRDHVSPFKMAPQFRADLSMVLGRGPTFDSLARVRPASRVGDPSRMDWLTGNDRARRLHEEAEGFRTEHYAKQLRESKGWDRFLRAMAFTNGMTDVPVNGSDSADVERDLRQRQQLRKQRVDSTRPR